MEDVADWLLNHVEITNRQLFDIYNPSSDAAANSVGSG